MKRTLSIWLCIGLGLTVACAGSSSDTVPASSTALLPVGTPGTTERAEAVASVPSPTEPASPELDAPPPTAPATGNELDGAGIRLGPLPEGYVAWGEAKREVDLFGPGSNQASQEYRDLEEARSVAVAIVTGAPVERLMTGAEGEQIRQLSERSVQGYDTYTLDLTRVSHQLQLSFVVDDATTFLVTGFGTTWDDLFDVADTIEVQR